MSTSYQCKSCRATFPFGSRLPGGTSLKCPKCSATFTIPAAPTKPSALADTRKLPILRGIKKAEPTVQPAPVVKTTPTAEFSIDAIARARTLPTSPARESEAVSPAQLQERKRLAARRWRAGLLGVGFALVVGLAVMAVRMIRPEPAPKVVPLEREPFALSDWQPFSPPNGHCMVLLPGQPTLVPPDNAPEAQLDETKPPEFGQYRLDRPDKEAWFNFYFVHLPPFVMDQQIFNEFYQCLRDEVIDRSGGKLRLETNLAWKGHTGWECQIETARAHTIIQRMYFVEHPNYIRLYVLQATVGVQHGPGTAAKYLDSLKLPPRLGMVAVADSSK